jgi:hypothetical protein
MSAAVGWRAPMQANYVIRVKRYTEIRFRMDRIERSKGLRSPKQAPESGLHQCR